MIVGRDRIDIKSLLDRRDRLIKRKTSAAVTQVENDSSFLRLKQVGEDLAIRIWADVSKALNLKVPMPAWQIVKEKRATFAATPQQDARRPAARTQWRNLFLAGDWTQTGLPATIEGALRSGETAAALALKHLSL